MLDFFFFETDLRELEMEIAGDSDALQGQVAAQSESEVQRPIILIKENKSF